MNVDHEENIKVLVEDVLDEAQLIGTAVRAAMPLAKAAGSALLKGGAKLAKSKVGKTIGKAAAGEAARTGVHGVKEAGKAVRKKITSKLNPEKTKEKDFESEEEENNIKSIIDDACSSEE